MTQGLPTPDNKGFLGQLRELVLVGQGLIGNRMDSWVTLRDLHQAGVVVPHDYYLKNGGGNRIKSVGSSVQPAYETDLTPPPTPTGFVATAGTTHILFQTAAPTYRQGHGHAKTIVFAANYSGSGPLPVFSDAVEYAAFPGNIDTSAFDPASNLHLWVEWESVDGVRSAPAGGTNGYTASTGLVDDAQIANLSAGKILAGSIAVGQYIQSADYVAGVSGWRIATVLGGSAFVEIRGNAVFGGTIFAGAGQIGGSTIGTHYIRSSNYVLTGQGWNLQDDGTGQIGGFVVGNTFIQSTNYIAGTTGWYIPNGAGTAQFSDILLTGGTIRNSSDSFHLSMTATGSALLLRAGPLTNYGSYAGNHYPVEINADGSGFFGRGIVAGGTVKASGSYPIPSQDRPAVLFYLAGAAPPPSDVGGGP